MSRACLMTGSYSARVSIPGVLFPKDTIGLNSSEITLAEIVKEKGCATVCIGKWHLGLQMEFLPTRQGFDHYFGLPYSNDMSILANGDLPLRQRPGQRSLGTAFPRQQEPSVTNLPPLPPACVGWRA